MRLVSLKRAALPLVMVVLLCPAAGLCRSDAPKSLAGYALGEDVSAYGDLAVDTAKPRYDQPWLARVNISPRDGLNGGYLLYGTCAKPGEVVRVKLSYADDGEGQFQALYKAMAKKWFEPQRSDFGGGFQQYKWSFSNAKGESLSLVLQHYAGDGDEYAQGNSLSLANRDRIEAEKACWQAKNAPADAQGKSQAPVPADRLIPE